MADNIFTSMNISGQGMSVQRMRLSAVAKNIANANTTKSTDGNPYRREIVTVDEVPENSFTRNFSEQISLVKTDSVHSALAKPFNNPANSEVLNAQTEQDATPPRLVYDPAHPDANENGYVLMPNVNIVTEMVEMISAQRAFEANTQVVDSAKNIARNSLEI